MNLRRSRFQRCSSIACLCWLACAEVPTATRHSDLPKSQEPAARGDYLRRVYQSYPETDFIVGYGVDDLSAEQAEQRAETDAAGQIRRSIQLKSTVVEEAEYRNGHANVRVGISQAIIERVSTGAGAYIHIERRFTERSADGPWQAVAVISRSEFDAQYAERGKLATSQFEATTNRFLTAALWQDQAIAHCDLVAASHALDQLNLERLLVSGTPVWSDASRADRLRADDRFGALKGTIRVEIERVPEPFEVDPTARIVESLRQSGWEAESTVAAACSSERGLRVDTALDSECVNASFGLVSCTLSLRFQGHACGSSALLFRVSSSAVHASDSRAEARARRSALHKLVAPETLDPFLINVAGRVRAALGDCLPPTEDG